MKRREFLAASCVGGVAPLAAAAAVNVSKKEFYELRLYQVATPEKAAILDTFFRDAAIPALNRLGVKPVGVFRYLPEDAPAKGKPKEPPMGPNDFYVLLPHASAESLATATAKLMCDDAFVKAGAAVLEAPKKDPVYTRIVSSIMLSFDEIPKLEAPAKGDRIFQMRIYESHNQAFAQRKIDMFNAGGEIALFRKVGVTPVFFGQTLAGPLVPNLTYMTTFKDQDERKAAWAKFGKHPEWDALKKIPKYKDTVSRITNMFLSPTDYSQI